MIIAQHRGVSRRIAPSRPENWLFCIIMTSPSSSPHRLSPFCTRHRFSDRDRKPPPPLLLLLSTSPPPHNSKSHSDFPLDFSGKIVITDRTLDSSWLNSSVFFLSEEVEGGEGSCSLREQFYIYIYIYFLDQSLFCLHCFKFWK